MQVLICLRDTNKEGKYLKTMYYQKNNDLKLRNVTQEYIPSAPPDFVLKVVVLFLVIIGIISVFSASVPKCINMGVSPLHFTYIQIGGDVI